MSGERPIVTEKTEDGALLTLRLARPKANVLDSEMVAALREAVTSEAKDPAVRAVLLGAEGRHFSFGASVEEHLPDSVAGMLGGFHALFRDLIDLHKPLIAVVQGQCLGGGAGACSVLPARVRRSGRGARAAGDLPRGVRSRRFARVAPSCRPEPC